MILQLPQIGMKFFHENYPEGLPISEITGGLIKTPHHCTEVICHAKHFIDMVTCWDWIMK